MISEDPNFDDVGPSGDPERDWIVTELRSGNPGAVDHPVPVRRMAETGRLVTKRAYPAKDLFACADDDGVFELIRSALAMESWSIGFSAFLLHGFWVPAAEAETALHSLRGHAAARMADRLLRTHDWLARALQPLHASHPDQIVFLAAALPAELQPERGVLAWRVCKDLLDQRDSLLQEVRTLRNERFAGITEGAGQRHKARPKRISQAVIDRAETYLAVLAWKQFKDERSSLDIAKRVIGLTQEAQSQLGVVDKPRVRLTDAQALERRLKDRWKELGISAPDGRRASKQTVK